MGFLGKFGGAIIGAGANLIGGVLANKQQRKQFNANYELSHDQLYKQHQIEVADLKAAGLNPILSANGGNSTFPASGGAIVTGKQIGRAHV